MGCLYRGFQFVVLFSLGAACLLAGMGLAVIGSERQALARLARTTSIRTLADVQRLDGPAWVKGILDPASGTIAIPVGQEQALWLLEEQIKPVATDIRRGGEWKQDQTVQKEIVGRREVAAVLRDGDGNRVTFSDWRGIDVGSDLLRKRGDLAILREWTEHGRWLASGAEAITVVSYLAPGTECWAWGKFQDGKPGVLEDGAFYLTSLGPEGFARERGGEGLLQGRLTWVLLGLGVVFCFFGLRSVRRWWQERVSSDTGNPA